MKEPSIAPAYAFIYPILCEAAREKGYALALHGSMQRDLDLIAVPWTDEARPAQELVQHIKGIIGGYTVTYSSGRPAYSSKPHGRVCWSIHLDGGVYIDLSVMPLIHQL